MPTARTQTAHPHPHRATTYTPKPPEHDFISELLAALDGFIKAVSRYDWRSVAYKASVFIFIAMLIYAAVACLLLDADFLSSADKWHLVAILWAVAGIWYPLMRYGSGEAESDTDTNNS